MTDLFDKAENAAIRDAFPLIDDTTAYLDNAATTQKPEAVLTAITDFYRSKNANPLRGLYHLAMEATDAYESARKTVANFIGSASPREILFTRNTSESLNLVAYRYARSVLQPGDEILISILEHHSNLLPWQQAAKATGAILRYVECDEQGRLTPDMLARAVTDKTRLIAVTQVSNVLGWENDIRAFAQIAHEAGAVIVVDGAQSTPHMPVNVQELDADFFAFSGHKIYGPMGIGVLYGKRALLEEMPPFLYGGEMIEYVERYDATYAPLPHKFEAGTVNAEGAWGLKAAIEYVESVGFDKIQAREDALTRLAMEEIGKIPHIHILGSPDPAVHHGIVTFTIDGVHPHDIAYILDQDQIDVRAGHHCAQPLMQFLGVNSTTRASFSFYNTGDEVLRLCEALSQIRRKMGYV